MFRRNPVDADSQAPPRRPGRWGRLVLPLYLAAPLLAFGIVQSLPEPRPDVDPVRRAEELLHAGLDEQVDEVLLPWVRRHLDDVELQYRFLALHFQRSRSPRRGEQPHDARVRRLYEAWRDSCESGPGCDAATYALGLYWSHLGEPRRAVQYFSSVADTNLPYLHNSWGYALMQLGHARAAMPHFRREIELGHNREGAAVNMARAHLRRHDWGALDSLLADPQLAGLVPGGARRAALLHQHRLGNWLLELARTFRTTFRWQYAIVALYGSLVWFLLVHWWDVFEKEPLGLSLLVMLLGAASSHGVFVVADLGTQWGGIDLGSGDLGDLLRWILSVGLVEEILKFLPVLVVYRFTRHIDEPIDWMVYACFSALGFAVWENYHYLTAFGLHIGVARVFLSTPMHVSMSGMLALCIPEARHHRWNLPLVFAVGLAGVAIVHGTFDFLGDWREGRFRLLVFALALGWGALFIHAMGSVQSLSPFRQRLDPARFSCTRWFVGAYVLLCLVSFLINAGRLTHAQAGTVLASDLATILLLVGLLRVFSRFTIGRRLAPPPAAKPEPAATAAIVE